MALVVENGSNVANANSFLTLAEIRAYATARGRTVPTDDEELEQLSTRAIDYIQSRRSEYQGTPTYIRSDDADPPVVGQTLPFPRTGMIINHFSFPSDEIPIEVKQLQAAIIIELAAGVDLFPTQTERALKRDKTGPLEKEYFDADRSPRVPFIEALIAPLLTNSSQFALRVRRV